MPLYDKVIEILYIFLDIKNIYKSIKISKSFLNVYRNINLDVLLVKANNKDEKLKIFLNFYQHLPKQGSIKWLENKKGSEEKPPVIGGSEMERLISNPREVVEKKLFGRFTGNIHTRWGNLFEEIFSKIFEFIFRTETVETGSVPGFKDEYGNTIQAYSPDRIMKINKDVLKSILFSSLNQADKSFKSEFMNFYEISDDQLIILNEFKCPSVRIPDGKIPKEYIHQPPTGVCTLKIIDLSLFANASFRKCSIKDFGMDNEYDKEFHSKDSKNIPEGFRQPIFMGMIGIYNNEFNVTKENVGSMSSGLKERVLEDILKKGSDYYGSELSVNNLASIVSLCYKFLKSMSHNLDQETENLIILNSVSEMLVIPPEMHGFYRDLIFDIIKVNRVLKPNMNYKYGYDLGKISERDLNSILEKAIENREKKRGYHIYYPEGMIVSEDILNELDLKMPNIAENYLDPTLQSKEKYQLWLKKNSEQFAKFCQTNGYTPVGIIPWKLFRVCIIPIFNDLSFLEKHKSLIYDTVNVIKELKQKAKLKFPNKPCDEELRKFYEEELDTIYKPKRKINRKPKEEFVFDQDYSELLDNVKLKMKIDDD